MSRLLPSDKELTGTSHNTEERNASVVNKRPTDEDYAQLGQIIIDKDGNRIYIREPLLGQGGFSRVYQVREEGNITENNNAILFADKVVSLEMLKRSKNAHEKVLKEISVHRDLSHENIVRLVHDFQDHHYIHIILEHCTMASLKDVLRTRKTVAETEARYYMHQILRGVQFIHQRGFLHCDMKLANISPELLDSHPNWEGSDVWACGIILYSLIFGRPPFQSNTVDATYEKIKIGDYSKPGDVSSVAEQIIDSMLAKNVEQRGHLDEEKSVDGYLLNHPFFTESFMPKNLPTCATFTDGWKFDFFDGAMPLGPLPPDKPYRMDGADQEEAVMTRVVNKAEWIIVDEEAPLQEPQGAILPQKETDKRFLDRVAQNLHKCQSICSNNNNEGNNAIKFIPVFIKRWISTNYGFIFELSDNSTGVLFKDRSRIAVKGESVETIDWGNKKVYYPNREAITDQGTLAQIKFLDGLSDTMKADIPDVTSDLDFGPYEVVDTNGQNKMTQIKRWNWNNAGGCAIMELSNHVVQFEANRGTLRVIVWEAEKPWKMFLTLIDLQKNEIITFSFASFFMMGCPQFLRPLMDEALVEMTPMLRKRSSLIDYVPR